MHGPFSKILGEPGAPRSTPLCLDFCDPCGVDAYVWLIANAA